MTIDKPNRNEPGKPPVKSALEDLPPQLTYAIGMVSGVFLLAVVVLLGGDAMPFIHVPILLFCVCFPLLTGVIAFGIEGLADGIRAGIQAIPASPEPGEIRLQRLLVLQGLVRQCYTGGALAVFLNGLGLLIDLEHLSYWYLLLDTTLLVPCYVIAMAELGYRPLLRRYNATWQAVDPLHHGLKVTCPRTAAATLPSALLLVVLAFWLAQSATGWGAAFLNIPSIMMVLVFSIATAMARGHVVSVSNALGVLGLPGAERLPVTRQNARTLRSFANSLYLAGALGTCIGMVQCMAGADSDEALLDGASVAVLTVVYGALAAEVLVRPAAMRIEYALAKEASPPPEPTPHGLP